MTEIYKALYDYDTDKEDELSLKEGETIKITNKDSPDWWLAERISNSKEYGLVPSNFIEKVVTKEGPNVDKKLAVIIRDYEAQDPEEISLQKDRIITVLDQNFAEGWWKGDSNGKIGVFPADHVKFVKEGEQPTTADNAKKDPFKLAAYGVKQGGIGSILAGGFSLKRASTTGNRQSTNDRPPSTVTVPTIPNKPPIIKTNTTPKSEVEVNIKPKNTKKAMVIHDYVPENDDEIPLMKGEYVTIVDQLEDDGWWKGTNENHVTGVFPSNFVQILEHESPPPRPTRTRPATVVKTESSSSSTIKVDDQMARPPPVPVNTRPTSLLTNRDSSTSSTLSRPVTLPPPKPTTSPPIPTKRNNSIISPPSVNKTHRRIPSVPLVSPDLPPISPVQSRQSRPPSSALTDAPPVIPSRKNEAIQNMAKPPKVNFKPIERPLSTNNDVAPVIPQRSSIEQRPLSNNNIDVVPVVPKRSSPPPVEKRPPHPNIALPSTPIQEEEEDVATMVKKLIQIEVNKIRKEFETRLEDERIERLKIQVELEELRKSLYQ